MYILGDVEEQKVRWQNRMKFEMLGKKTVKLLKHKNTTVPALP